MHAGEPPTAVMARIAAPCVALPLGGCAGVQSVFAPAGPAAASTAALAWVLIAGAAVIFAVVMALVGLAVWLRPRWLASRAAIVIGGALVPLVTLSVLLIAGVRMTGNILTDDQPPALAIEVVGEQWWWRVRYLDAGGAPQFETANEIHLPVGELVELRLHTADVIHSFWVPALAGKLDMIPGQVNRLRLRATRPGLYRGQCAEYCGTAHAQMGFFVVVAPGAEFAAWVERQRAAAREPDDPLLRQGRDAFLAAGCGACHTIRGVQAVGVIGPDLTHVGSRVSLAAATLPNNLGTLAAWIVTSQHLKPGNRMPPGYFDRAGLNAVAAYLRSLE